MAVQPPSGGCVLKLKVFPSLYRHNLAATFGWLCVETYLVRLKLAIPIAATFGWLCVETYLPE